MYPRVHADYVPCIIQSSDFAFGSIWWRLSEPDMFGRVVHDAEGNQELERGVGWGIIADGHEHAGAFVAHCDARELYLRDHQIRAVNRRVADLLDVEVARPRPLTELAANSAKRQRKRSRLKAVHE